MAIIRMNKMNETKRALAAAGITAMTATGRVQGRGRGIVDYRVLKAAEEGNDYAVALLGSGPRLMSKRLILIVVPDDKVKVTIKTIIETNQTGQAGDGKIFVLPCLDAFRVRGGDHGERILL
jgi:nitrogen regulatory protein PII 2